ncbi:MAG: hypothetical protein WBH40_16855 [Ignavibacteriaceae bacterium]
MKIALTTLLLIAIFLLGCADTPVSPVKKNDHSYQLIKLPKKSGMSVETIFSKTKTINGNLGGRIIIRKSYVADDGHTVSIYAKLKIRENSFEGSVDITLTVDDEFAAVEFSPAMVFDMPVELSLRFEGIDLEELNLTTGDYDFAFIDDNGDIELIVYNSIHVNQDMNKIWVSRAKLPHFSRYGFVH